MQFHMEGDQDERVELTRVKMTWICLSWSGDLLTGQISPALLQIPAPE